MAPDQTIRVMESNFDICDGQIRFFPAFLMEIFDRFEVFRLYSLSKGWKSSTFRNFPIIFPFQRMEILDISKFSDYIPFPKDGNPRHFEIFRLYSLFKGWNAFDLHIDKLIWLRSNKKRLVYGKKRWRVIRFEYHFTMHLQYYRSLMFTETTKGQGRDNNIFHIILHFVIFFLLMYSLSSSWKIEVKIGFYVCLTGKSCWVK
jgi:hypothetical protein